eukprot:3235902-Pleurochrysis_carterae.AAC.1
MHTYPRSVALPPLSTSPLRVVVKEHRSPPPCAQRVHNLVGHVEPRVVCALGVHNLVDHNADHAQNDEAHEDHDDLIGHHATQKGADEEVGAVQVRLDLHDVRVDVLQLLRLRLDRRRRRRADLSKAEKRARKSEGLEIRAERERGPEISDSQSVHLWMFLLSSASPPVCLCACLYPGPPARLPLAHLPALRHAGSPALRLSGTQACRHSGSPALRLTLSGSLALPLWLSLSPALWPSRPSTCMLSAIWFFIRPSDASDLS